RGRRVAIRVEQPLEPLVDAARGGSPAIIEYLDRNPGRLRGNTDRASAASPPTITPMVHVPWPLTSVGVVGCSPFGSYKLLVPPRQRLARSGWLTVSVIERLGVSTHHRATVVVKASQKAA
ncbi:MAG TPA: hypothetical protein VII16_06790, partial [Actinomycetes bacterium]